MSEIRQLEIQHAVSLYPTAPFNFDGTVHKPSHFPSSDNDYEEGAYWQTMRFIGKVFGIKMTNEGSIDNPRVRLEIYADGEILPDEVEKIRREIEYRYDMKTDISDFYDKFADDEILGPVLERWRGMRVMVNVSLYEFLVIATVLQNATVRRSRQMLEKLFERYGLKVVYDGKELSVFWTPQDIYLTSEEELRSLKVGYRAKHLKRQAEQFAIGKIDEFNLRSLPSDRLKEILLGIYGIGPASVWYLMFEVFKRYDALDYISPWEQKIYSRLLFGKEMVDSEVILEYVNERWGEWKMLAAHYLFEDLFWQRKTLHIPWLEDLIHL